MIVQKKTLWATNQEYDKNVGDKNDILRIFKIMEEMSQRIIKIENKKWNNIMGKTHGQ